MGKWGIHSVEAWGTNCEVLEGRDVIHCGIVRSLERSLMGARVNIYDCYGDRSANGVP